MNHLSPSYGMSNATFRYSSVSAYARLNTYRPVRVHECLTMYIGGIII